jgi:hypothetical protein
LGYCEARLAREQAGHSDRDYGSRDQKQLGSRILLSIDPNPTRAEQSLERAKGNERKIQDVKQRYSLAKVLESLG